MRKYTQKDLYYYKQGNLFDAYEIFGAHLYIENNQEYTRFIVFAPHAKEVYLVGDFNSWQGDLMENNGQSGIWIYTYNTNLSWQSYKYKIITYDNQTLYKSDPYAFYTDVRPGTNSKVCNLNGYQWNDELYMYTKKPIYEKPLAIYELHLGSFRQENQQFKPYNVIIDDIVNHVLKHHFTHIELMPIYEHPFDGSWGYQGTNYFAPTSRYGVPLDFMYFVDRCHQANIGVILDWVPGHICKDNHGLYMFDGKPLYEYEDYEKRENEVWGTANLDLSRGFVKSFLISNALFWMKYYHIDGFRVDAVSNLIYFSGNENDGINYSAIDFLRKTSIAIFKEDDRVLFIAEDSTSFPFVTKPVSDGGLGFNYKWNMGWMNDVLAYFSLDPIYRKYHHQNITFGMTYAYSEQFILPFSHDEVVHGKYSLLNKMPGDYWQKFAHFRLLIGFWITHPGKKLIFMGQEFAQFSEWDFNKELDWMLFDYEAHRNANKFMIDCLAFYNVHPELYANDHHENGFKWIDCDNHLQSIFSYIRIYKNDKLIIIMNATPNTYQNYKIGVPDNGTYYELLNSDDKKYGGANNLNIHPIIAIKGLMHKMNFYIEVTIPPLGITIFKR